MRSAPSATALPRGCISIGWRRQLPSAAMVKRLLRVFLTLSLDAQLTLIETAEGMADPCVARAPLRLVVATRDTRERSPGAARASARHRETRQACSKVP